MASPTRLQILIDIAARVAGLERSIALTQQLKSVAAGLFVGVGLGLTQQLAEIPQIIKASISDGLNFNATLESSRIGVASIIKAFDTSGKFQNFDAAIAESGRAVDFLKSKAVETEATFQELLEGYQAAAGPAFAAGINSTRDQVKLTVALSQAMSALTIPAREMSQEIRGVFEGDTSRQSRLNQVLRITKAEIDQAALSGTAYQLVMGRLRSFTEGAQRGQQTYNVAMSNFGDILTQLKAAGTEDLFERIKNKILEINKELSKDQTREAVVGWSAGLTSIVEKTVSGIKTMAAAIPPAIKAELEFERDLIKGAFGSVGQDAAIAAGIDFAKTAQQRLDVIEQSILAAKTFEERLDAHVARERLILDLSTRTKDENGLIALAAQQTIPHLEKMAETLSEMRKNAQGTAGAMQATKEQIEAAIKVSEKLQTLNLETARIAAKAGDDATASRIIRATVQPSIEITSTGATEKRIKLSEFEIELMRTRIELEKQFGALGQDQIESSTNADVRIQKLREIHAQEEGNKTATEAAAAAHKDITTLLRAQETTIAGIRQQQELINQNPYLTISEKNAQLLALMRLEIETLNAEVAKGQALLTGGTLDPSTYEQVRQKVQEARFEMELLLQKTSTLNFTGGLKAELIDWANSFGTAAQQVGRAITGSINTALDATATALTGIIFQTSNWRQTALSAAQSIVSSLIKVGLQMLINAGIGAFTRKQSDAGAIQSGATITAAYTPASVAATGATSGSNWIFGAIAAAAAIAAIIALLVGFEGGGSTGFGGTKQIAGFVHGQEFVQPQPAVSYYGLQAMEAIRQRRIPAGQLQALIGNYRYQVTPRLGSFEMGGAVAAIESSAESSSRGDRGGGETRVEVLHFMDPDKLAQHALRSDAGIMAIVDAVNGKFHIIRRNA